MPELLAPAGDEDALDAAIANGADAVYFGLSDFNARHRATNFTLEQLPTIMSRLHTHAVKGYVAFNTLIFSDELERAAEYLGAVSRAGVDAVIVQDFGLARLLSRLAPGLAVHGSTQMTLTEWRGIEFVRRLGIERVILARELSLGEIETIRQQTDLPVEVFVHGALCVAYSGQCLTSESFGGRSANRGKCAQACRQPYELIVDGSARDLGDKAYLLSPQDLAAHELIGDLTRLGVASVKIEGRLKGAHYVAATTRAYRQALSAAARQQDHQIDPEDDLALRQSFSRGFTHGFLSGVNHQRLVQGRFPKHRGVRLGTVVACESDSLLIQLDPERATAPRSAAQDAQSWDHVVKPGDGIVIDEGRPEQDEQGGRVFAVRPVRHAAVKAGAKPSDVVLSLSLGRGDVQPGAVSVGAIVWKTDDPALRKRLERQADLERLACPSPVRVVLRGEPGQPLRCELSDSEGRTIRVETPAPLEAARKHPLAQASAVEQFSRLGGTPFTLGSVELRGDDELVCEELPVMAPRSVLNELRRSAVAALLAIRSASGQGRTVDPEALSKLRDAALSRRSGTPNTDTRKMTVLVRSLSQFQAALDWVVERKRSAVTTGPLVEIDAIYCDFEDVRGYREAVQKASAAGIVVGLATPRVIKPAETGLLKQVQGCRPEIVLVRNLAALEFFRGVAASDADLPLRLRGDYSLNVTNELTAELFFEHGLETLTPGYDLNLDQLESMLGRSDPAGFELVLHQHMPMFHMEHCVFSHVLSNGTDWHSCGRPCDRHLVELRDHVGEAHPLVADVGCRNTVFNARPQSAGRFLGRLLETGLRRFRIELLREQSRDVAPLLSAYADLLAGKGTGPRLNQGLRVLDQLGVVGTLGFE